MKKFVLTGAALLLLAFSVQAIGPGDRAPEISGPDMNGKTIRLSDFRGKVVMIEFWASWCGPCRTAMPKTQAKQDKYGARGFVVLAVGLNRNPGTDMRFMRMKKYRFKAMIFTGGRIPGAYNITGIPHAVLVGRDGRIVWRGHPMSLQNSTIEQALGR